MQGSFSSGRKVTLAVICSSRRSKYSDGYNEANQREPLLYGSSLRCLSVMHKISLSALQITSAQAQH